MADAITDAMLKAGAKALAGEPFLGNPLKCAKVVLEAAMQAASTPSQLPDDGLIKALEEMALYRPPTSETFSYQADGYAAGWNAAIRGFQAKARDQIEALSRHKAPLSALQVTEGDRS